MCGNSRRGQEAQQLELRVDARLEPAEHLEDQLVAEDDRGVGLLDADRPHVDGAAEAGVRAAPRQRKCSVAVLARDLLPSADAVPAASRLGRVGERVVDRPAVDLADHPLVPALVVGAQPERQLVELVRAGLEARLDEREHQLRRLLAQRDGLEHVELRDLARLGREPALLEHPLVQALLGQRGDDGVHRVTHRSAVGSSSTSWNQ